MDGLILGIDPGKSGGFALVTDTGAVVYAFDKHTPTDIVQILKLVAPNIKMAYLEQVSAMPKQGVCSVFTFGQNYGWWQGVLTALGIRIERVTPQKWQAYMKCRTGGDKNVSKARAQELFPEEKITHAVADALLIGEYGRRVTGNTNVEDL
jgi:crossover junction endodeoxyribonuclease RuvC